MSRSINSDTRGASVKKIIPDPEIYKGLCLATLTGVELGTAEIKNDSSWVDFQGKVIPRITFIFTEKVASKDKEEGMYFRSFSAYPDVFNPDNEWQWNTLSQTLKHFIDVLSENEFKDEYAALLDLKLEEEKSYEVDDQIKVWQSFFDGVIKVFRGSKKEGLPELIGKIVWMKLLLDVKGRQVNNGDFGLSGFPGDGVIELYKENISPTIRINISKGENIMPKAYEEPDPIAETGNDTSGKRPEFMK